MERGWGRTLSRASGDTLLRVRHYVFLGPRMHLRTGSGSGEREATAATGPACLASHRPLGTALALASTSTLVSTPAHAQFGGIVYDPSNYAQNVLTAARTLEQINNQIRMLQNQATSLINEAKNLQSLPLTIVQPLQDQIRQTQQLLNEAQRIAYDVRTIEGAFDQHYKNVPLGASQRAMVEGAEARWQNSVAAFEDALKVQAGTVANIEGSREALGSLASASQSATGAL